MTKQNDGAGASTRGSGGARGRITLERNYRAPIDDVWDLWTTKEGIESWWGPQGFEVKVRSLDLRPGGILHYAMIAIGPQQVAYMKNAGMPLTSELQITYSDIVVRQRLAYFHKTNFVSGVEPYDVEMVVTLTATANGVRMVLDFDAMHDETWTQRMVMGWESELGKLAKVLGE